MQQRIKEDFLKKHLPLATFEEKNKKKNHNYMIAILEMAEKLIKESPSHCIICGQKMTLVGLKPTVCEKAICVFSHEQYGLGVDLESSIKKEPEIVGMLPLSIFVTNRFEFDHVLLCK